MRVLIISDTHRNEENYYDLLKTIGHLDMIIHCGDTEGMERIMELECDCPFVAVMGNNDWFSFTPEETVLELEGHRIFITHGNTYRVHASSDRVIDEGMDRDCDIVLYGHTHVPEIRKKDGVTVCNPGSISYPRQRDRMPTYAIMNLKENEKPDIKIYDINGNIYDV